MSARASFAAIHTDAVVVHLPMPMTHDAGEIARGRARAAQAYRDATTPAEWGRALIWINHWRQLHEHAEALAWNRICITLPPTDDDDFGAA